jgi:hypothetical protein
VGKDLQSCMAAQLCLKNFTLRGVAVLIPYENIGIISMKLLIGETRQMAVWKEIFLKEIYFFARMDIQFETAKRSSNHI